MIPKPIKTYRAKNGSIGFKFSIKDFPNGESDGLYYVRGAVCWPILDEVTSRSQGWALLAAQNIKTKNVVVFESTPFTHISNMVEDNQLISSGFVEWFRAVWEKYYCKDMFWSGAYATHHQYLMEVIRNRDIDPAPYFIEIPMKEGDDAVSLLYHMRAKDSLIIDVDQRRDDSKTLVNELMTWEQTKRNHTLAAVQCLLTLVSGFAKYPFRPNKEEAEEMMVDL